MWGGKVSLNKKSLVLLGISSRKSARLLSNICALSLFELVARKIFLNSCDKTPSLTYSELSLAVTRVKSQILFCATLPSGNVLFMTANAACKAGTDTAPDGMNNVCGLS
eukprot:1611115-Ditylum_brightwellii.AAC.1